MSKKIIAELTLELDRRKALVLGKYPPPIPLDKAAAMAGAVEKTKLGQLKVTAFYVSKTGVATGYFTANRDYWASAPIEPLVWYGSEIDAKIAQRNQLALTAADRLIALDRVIEDGLDQMSVDVPAVLVEPASEVSGVVGDAAEQQEAEADTLAQAQGITDKALSADDATAAPDDFMPEVPEYKQAQAAEEAAVEAAVAKPKRGRKKAEG